MTLADRATLDAFAADADARATDNEAGRRLVPPLVDALISSGLARALAPRELGAAELSVAEFVDEIERLAVADGATAWCAMIAGTTSILGGYLPPAWAEAIYGDPRSCTGGFAAPVGRATRTSDGLQVSGRWQWGSGTQHCTSIGGGALVVDADGAPAPLDDGTVAPFVFFEPDQVEFLDTWHVAGLRGTGSTDYAVTDAVVPEGRWSQVGRSACIDRPLYRFSFFGALAVGVAAVGLGLAQRAQDELVAVAAGKKPQGSSKTLAERAVIQEQLAIADAQRRAARLLLHDAIAGACEVAEASAGPDAPSRLALRQAATHAMVVSADSVTRCYHAVGGSAVYDTSPIQRVFRDVHVATQHAMVAPRLMEVVGRAAFGLDVDTRQL